MQEEIKTTLACPASADAAMANAQSALAEMSSLDWTPLDYALHAARLAKYNAQSLTNTEESFIGALKKSNKTVLMMKNVIRAHSFLVKHAGAGENFAKYAQEVFPMCTHFKK